MTDELQEVESLKREAAIEAEALKHDIAALQAANPQEFFPFFNKRGRWLKGVAAYVFSKERREEIRRQKEFDDDIRKFMNAAIGGELEAIDVFLQKYPKGAGVVDQDGMTALHWAAMNGQTEFIVKLLPHLSWPVAALDLDKDGNTPLMLAVDNGHIEIFEGLMQGIPVAEFSRKNAAGLSALDIAEGEGLAWIARLIDQVREDAVLREQKKQGVNSVYEADWCKALQASRVPGMERFSQFMPYGHLQRYFANDPVAWRAVRQRMDKVVESYEQKGFLNRETARTYGEEVRVLSRNLMSALQAHKQEAADRLEEATAKMAKDSAGFIAMDHMILALSRLSDELVAAPAPKDRRGRMEREERIRKDVNLLFRCEPCIRDLFNGFEADMAYVQAMKEEIRRFRIVRQQVREEMSFCLTVGCEIGERYQEAIAAAEDVYKESRVHANFEHLTDVMTAKNDFWRRHADLDKYQLTPDAIEAGLKAITCVLERQERLIQQYGDVYKRGGSDFLEKVHRLTEQLRVDGYCPENGQNYIKLGLPDLNGDCIMLKSALIAVGKTASAAPTDEKSRRSAPKV